MQEPPPVTDLLVVVAEVVDIAVHRIGAEYSEEQIARAR
jgi:hypothetical protein